MVCLNGMAMGMAIGMGFLFANFSVGVWDTLVSLVHTVA